MLSLFSPPFPTASLIESRCESCALGSAQPGRACEVCSEHRQHWDSFPLGTKGTSFGNREESVSTKQSLSCQGVERGMLQWA